MRSEGFTLIEVLVAMVILSIAFVALLVHENRGIDYAMHAKFLTTSTLLAERHIAELEEADTSTMTGEKTGDFGEDYPGYTYTESIETTLLTGYYKYSLRVEWGGEGNGFENSFVTYLSILQ